MESKPTVLRRCREVINYRSPATKKDILNMLIDSKYAIFFGEYDFPLERREPMKGSAIYVMAEIELNETPENVASSLQELKRLIADDQDFSETLEEHELRIFLRRCKWHAEHAFSLIKGHYKFYADYSRIYKDFLTNDKRIYDSYKLISKLIYLSPIRCNDGCRLILLQLGTNWDMTKASAVQIFNCVATCLQSLLREPKTQIAGVHFIIDMDGLTEQQLTYFDKDPNFAKMVVDFVQNCIPMRIKSINVVYHPHRSSVESDFSQWSFNEKYLKRIHFHGTNWTSLTNIVDKNALYAFYGGYVPITAAKYDPLFWKRMVATQESFKFYHNPAFKLTEDDKRAFKNKPCSVYSKWFY